MGGLFYYPGLKFKCRGCADGCCSRLEVSLEPGEAASLGGGFPRNAAGDFILAKDASGRCPYLEGNLCSIHLHKGYGAKPLSCRIYPLHIQCWEDGADSAELRYLCPGVGGDEAEILPEEKIERLAREFRRTRKDFDRAVFSHRNPAGLGAVRKFHAGIKAMLEEKSLDLPLRIYAAAKALDFHLSPGEDETVKNIDEKFAENSLSFLRRASGLLAEEKGKLTENALRRSRFRNLICAFLRNDQPGESRWKRAYIQLKILLGMEYLQKLNPLAPRCGIFAITNLHKDCVYAPEAGKYLEEWFYSKVYSMHFCGRMVHNYPYSTGLRLLFCAFAAAEYLAGGFAIAEHLTGKRNGENPENPGRIPVNLSDMKRAVFLVDFSFSRSPAFRFAGTRKLIEECGRAENIGFLLK